MAEGNLGELVAYLGADISQMQQALKHAESLLKNYDRTSAQVVNSSSSGFSKIATGATRAFSTMQKGISSVSNALFSLKTTIAGFGVGMLAKSFIDAASQAEILRMRLQTLTGHGKELFDILHNWAARMPVDTAKAIDVFTMLTGYGLKPTLDMMTTLVDTGLALSGTTEGFYNIALALGQIQTHGRLLGGELRQLASAGYNAAEVLREEFGLTAKEMENLGETLTKRGISASQIINILLEDMKERFGGMSKAMESSWTGLVERIEEAWWNLRLMIAESGPFQLLKEQLDRFLQAWESAEGQLKIREWAEEAGAAIVNALEMAINAAKLLLPHLEKILRILIAMKGISVGAALGTAVGGPVGAVIGSTVGGVAGYLSPEILRGIFGEKEARKGIEELQKALAELDKQKSELEKELQKISEDSAKSWLHRPIFGGAKEEVVRKQITAIDDARQKIITAIEEYKKDLDAASENIAHGKSMEELLGGKGKGEGAAGGATGGGTKKILADINWAYQQGLITLENFYAKASSMLSGLTKSSEDFQFVFATTQAAAMELATKRMEEYTASFISGGMSVDEYDSKVKELLGTFSQFPLAGKAIEELSGKGLIERSKAVNAEIMLSIELSKRMEQELLDAQEAAAQGIAKFWSEVAWEYQQGFISSQEYFDMLKSEVSELTVGTDEWMRRFSELQAVASTIAQERLEPLLGALEQGKISTEEFTKLAEALKAEFGEYPLVIKQIDDAIKQAEETTSSSVNLAKDFGMVFKSAFEEAVFAGNDLRDVLAGLLEDIARIILRVKVIEPLVGMILKGLPFSKGGVVENGKVTPFAIGGIVNRPTIFPMASGFGLMGEAGPEAILPLARTPSGDLGVKATAGGVIVQVFDQRKGGEPVEVKQDTVGNQRVVKIMIREAVKELINEGSLDKAMGTFGVRRVARA